MRRQVGASSLSPRADVARLFRARSIAIVGASPRNHYAVSALRSLRNVGFDGRVACIHPRAEPLLDYPAYSSLGAVRRELDAAMLVIGRERVPAALEECAAAGIRAVTVITAGFAERDALGRELEQGIAETARRYGMALCGPNCLGYVAWHDRFATYASTLPPSRAGNVAVLSHSGGLLNEVLSYGDYRGLAFSYAVSAGNEAVLDLSDYLEFLVQDERTAAIGLIIEGVRSPARFRAALAAAVDFRKPIVAMKIGSSPLAARAAATHTGAMVGSAEVFTALCKQYGVTLVEDVDGLCEALLLLSAAKRLLWSRREPGGVAAIEISGGGKALICDLAERHKAALPMLDPASERRISGLLPAGARAGNPLDVLLSWDAPGSLDLHHSCLAALAEDPGIDVILSRVTVPSAGEIATALAHGEAVAAAQRAHPDRLFAILGRASGRIHDEWRSFCIASGTPYLQGYRRGLVAVGALLGYRRFLIGETVPMSSRAAVGERGGGGAPDRPPEGNPAIVLDEAASKELLTGAGFPVNPTRFAADAGQAAALATAIGYPVVLKGISARAVHKSDLGLVAMPLRDTAAVSAAADRLLERLAALGPSGQGERVGLSVQPWLAPGLEVIVGGYRDPLFGPVVLCGLGGVWTEVLGDRALRLSPLTLRDAAQMIAETRIEKMARGFRGLPPCDLAALGRLLVRAGDWLRERPDVEEFDLNPVICRGPDTTIADARVVLTSVGVPDSGRSVHEPDMV